MIVLNKNAYNEFVLYLNEDLTISNPYFIFNFKDIYNNDNIITLEDLSTETSYNKFGFIDPSELSLTASGTYYVYESAVDSSTIDASMNELENGLYELTTQQSVDLIYDPSITYSDVTVSGSSRNTDYVYDPYWLSPGSTPNYINNDLTVNGTLIVNGGLDISINTQGATYDYVDGSLAKRDESINTLFSENDTQDASIKVNSDDIYTIENSITNILDYNLIQDNSISTLFDENDSQDVIISDINSDINDLQNKDITIDASIDSLNSDISDINTYQIIQDASISTLFNENDTQDASIVNLNTYNSIQDTSINTLFNENDTQDASISDINSDISDLQNKDVTLDASIDSLNSDISNINSYQDIQDTSINTLFNENDTQDASIDGLNSDISNINTYNSIQDTSINTLFSENDTQDASIIDINSYQDEQDVSIAWININKADISYVDGSLNLKLNNTTDNFIGVLTIDGSLVITGDIIQDGSTYITHAENIQTEADFITMREGAIAALPDGSISGLLITKANGTNDVILGSDKNAVMRVGWSGDILQAIATREDTPTDGYYAYWDDSSTMFKTYDLKGYIDGSLNDKADNTDIPTDFYSQSYIDGSLTERDVSIAWLNTNKLESSDIADFYSKTYIDGSLNSKQNLITDGTYVKEASIGSGLAWNSGLLDVSIVADVTKAYVDGSLALRDSSIEWLANNTGVKTLFELNDVSIGGELNNQVLAYDVDGSTYMNKTIVDGSLYSVVDASDYFWILKDTSIDYSTIANNQSLAYDSTSEKWINKTLVDSSLYDIVDASDYIQPKIVYTDNGVASDATGTIGDWATDASYLYVCVSTNTWGRLLYETGY